MKFWQLFSLIFLCNACTGNDSVLKKLKSSNPLQGQADVVFLLDRSGSVGKANFEIEKGFVESLLMHVVVDANATRVAIISYSTTPKLHIDYIRNPKSKCFLAQEMLDVEYQDSEATDISAALELAGDVLSYGRVNVNKIIILVSDGMATHGDDPIPVAKRLKDQDGVEIFAFGVGKFLKTQLLSMASSPSHMYTCLGFVEFRRLAREIRGDPHDGKYSKDETSTPNCDHLCVSPYRGEPDDPGCCDHHAQCSCALLSGTHTCVCQPGYFGLSGTWGKCRACPRGTYKSKLEPSASCVPCPPDAITAEEASTSIKDCYCKIGYVGNPENGLPCIAVKCPLLQNPTNGFLLGTCDNKFGSTCHFMCHDSFELVDSKTDILTCQSDGQWSENLPVCRRILCSRPLSPVYGRLKCPQTNLTVGTTCRFSCLNGFVMKGTPVRECLPNRRWSGSEVTCVPIECPVPATLVHGKVINCGGINKPTFDTTCIFRCNSGFKLIGPDLVICNAEGMLIDRFHKLYISNQPRCLDIQAPEIRCPKPKERKSQPGLNLAIIHWEDPVAYDNSGMISEIQIFPPGLKSPAKFSIGTTLVSYKISDGSGLIASCNFTVTVFDNERPHVLSCPSTVMANTTDSSEQVHWQEPVFRDNSLVQPTIRKTHSSGDSFDIGRHIVTYSATDSSHNTAYCQFEVIVTENICPYYRPPINGALACEDWMFGQFCQAYCSFKYDFATKPANWYFCDHEAKWTTDPIGYSVPWPDCLRRISPNGIRQMVRGYYFLGDCREASVQKAIKHVFLKHFTQEFDKHKYCATKGACTLDLVKVSCGEWMDLYRPLHRIVKRGIGQNSTRKAQKLEVEIYIDLHQDLEMTDDSLDELQKAFAEDWNINKELERQFERTNSSSIPDDFQGASLRPVEVTSVEVQLLCSPGSILIGSECMLCPPGSYHDVQKDSCANCAIGEFQEKEGQTGCVTCPPGTTTLDGHSTSKDECRGICSEGMYSQSGLETCLACPTGTYQDEKQQTGCKACESGTTTFHEASTSLKDCASYCLPGSFSDFGLKPCTNCPVGFYQTDVGESSCEECPAGLTTILNGSESIADCINYNPCRKDYLCENGGICFLSGHVASCLCPVSFTGSRCEEDVNECLNSPCSNNGTCVNFAGSFHCNCSRGFEGPLCEAEIDECKASPCGLNGTCLDQYDGYLCICDPGFTGSNCDERLDSCSNDIICLNGGYCETSQEHDGILCRCASGFDGSDCSININDCINVTCHNGGRCIDGLNEYHCNCSTGYTGSFCEMKVNHCAHHLCHEASTCISIIDSYKCVCPPGQSGDRCNETLSSDFVLHFPKEPSLENMASVALDSALSEVTLSLWVQINASDERTHTLISYAALLPSSNDGRKNKVVDNALTVTYGSDVGIYVNNELLNVDVAETDDRWHHLAFTWTSNSGEWKFYMDGTMLSHGNEVQTSKVIPGGGLLVVGQEQDDVGAGFSLIESFSGNITRLNIWGRHFSQDSILRLHELQDDLPGKVTAWSDFRNSISGNVLVLENTVPLSMS